MDRLTNKLIDVMQKYGVAIKLAVEDHSGGTYLGVEVSNSSDCQVRQFFKLDTYTPEHTEEVDRFEKLIRTKLDQTTVYSLDSDFEEQLENMAKLLTGKEVK